MSLIVSKGALINTKVSPGIATLSMHLTVQKIALVPRTAAPF